jgi:hypothetical protein
MAPRPTHPGVVIFSRLVFLLAVQKSLSFDDTGRMQLKVSRQGLHDRLGARIWTDKSRCHWLGYHGKQIARGRSLEAKEKIAKVVESPPNELLRTSIRSCILS